MHIFDSSKSDLKHFSCRICEKAVKDNHVFTDCTFCNHRIHNKCNRSIKNHFLEINDQNSLGICLKCQEENLPFFNLIGDTKAENKSFKFNGHVQK